MINISSTYAIVGASANPEKYGYKVLKDFIDGGYKTIPVNPKKGEILNQKVYANLSEIIPVPDVVIFIVPPEIALKVLKEAKDLGIKKFWFQPGSESLEAEKYCQDNQLEAVFNACIMIKRRE